MKFKVKITGIYGDVSYLHTDGKLTSTTIYEEEGSVYTDLSIFRETTDWVSLTVRIDIIILNMEKEINELLTS